MIKFNNLFQSESRYSAQEVNDMLKQALSENLREVKTGTNGAYVAYFRVSSSEQGQSGLGLQGQWDSVISHLQRNDLHLVDAFIEANSSYHGKQVELDKAISLCREIGATLVVDKQDRLSRQGLVGTFKLSEELDGRLITLDNLDGNEMLRAIKAIAANSEQKNKGERISRALREINWQGTPSNFTDASRKKGRMARSAKSLRLNRKNIKFAVDLHNDGLSDTEIMKRMNRYGFTTTKGTEFTHHIQIKRLIKQGESL